MDGACVPGRRLGSMDGARVGERGGDLYLMFVGYGGVLATRDIVAQQRPK